MCAMRLSNPALIKPFLNKEAQKSVCRPLRSASRTFKGKAPENEAAWADEIKLH